MILAIPEREHLFMDFIQREQATTDELPPWAGISFKQPVDSDELADLLKKAYPDCRTLRERKHKAAIDFLLQELDRMRAKEPVTPTTLPTMDLRHRNGSQTCIEISPDRSRPQSLSDYTSPSLTGSLPSPSISERARLDATINSGPQRLAASNTNPPQLVWDSHNGQPMRPKTKRKMTTDERKAYKKIREQGACEACRKQKARCTHAIEIDTSSISVERSKKAPKRKPTPPAVDDPAKMKIVKVEHPQQPAPQSPEVARVYPSLSAQPRNTPGEPPTEPTADFGPQNFDGNVHGVSISLKSEATDHPEDHRFLSPTNTTIHTFNDTPAEGMIL